jgi:hypothetical protein
MRQEQRTRYICDVCLVSLLVNSLSPAMVDALSPFDQRRDNAVQILRSDGPELVKLLQ